jgi:ribosomal protein S18 acetylase RimI-like enzyme
VPSYYVLTIGCTATGFPLLRSYKPAREPGVRIALYNRSTLGERRPVHRPDVFEQMLKHSNLIITAWHQDSLVGIARSLTDFAYVAYLSDLAVDSSFQRMGIGQQLIKETQAKLWPECKVVLLSAPKANGYYPKLGFEPYSMRMAPLQALPR